MKALVKRVSTGELKVNILSEEDEKSLPSGIECIIEIPQWVVDEFCYSNIRITDDKLISGAAYVHAPHGDSYLELDGGFSLKTIKAIVWWLENVK